MGYSIRRARFRPRTRDFGVRNLTRFVRLEVRFKRLIALLSCVSPTESSLLVFRRCAVAETLFAVSGGRLQLVTICNQLGPRP